MIVTIVLIGLAFFTVFLITRTVDRSSAVMFEPQHNSFDNLKNAITTRNGWIGTYWWNLAWENRIEISITMPAANPVEIDPQIPAGINCDLEVRVIDSAGTELQSNVNEIMSPCNVIFNAPAPGTGTFYIYYNNTAAERPAYRDVIPDTGNAPTYDIVAQDSSPKLKFCGHMQDMAMATGERLDCGIQNIIGTTRINYTINYTTLDFSFTGFLS